MYWNIDANTIIDLGPVGVNPWADLCLADGQYYTSSAAGIWNINVNDPGSSSLLFLIFHHIDLAAFPPAFIAIPLLLYYQYQMDRSF